MNEKTESVLKAPKASKEDFLHEKFGVKRKDPYFWMRNKDSSEVLDYLKKENEYAKQNLKPLSFLREELFEEMKARLPEKQDQEPVPVDDYFYYSTWEKQKAYPIHKRKKKSGGKSSEEILLDENTMANQGDYLDVSDVTVSPDHQILAYSIDEKGREFYNTYFKNLKTGEKLPHFISSATSSFVWANDNKTVFYIRQDKETLRSFQVYRFDIETGEEELVYEEKDTKFSVYLNKSLCETWITLLCYSPQTTEYRYLPASEPEKDWTLFCKRKFRHEYHLEYGDGIFYVMSNKDKAFNFKIMKVHQEKKRNSDTEGEGAYPSSLWEEFIPHRPEVFIENYEVFKDFLALEIRFQGRLGIEIFDFKKQDLHKIAFSEQIFCVSFGDNEEYDSSFFRLEFESPTQPAMVYDYEVSKRKLHFKSQREVKGDFDSKNYVSRGEEALAPDGEKIPISLVHKKGLKLSPSTPLLLYSYGSYGYSTDPSFSSICLSLLDRGFVFAIAHIRGGSEKGRKWYEEGKLLKKKNTFSDFISCARYLIEKSYTSPTHLYIMGGSAGGLLMGAVLNESPELFRGAIASVPFVDCLSTMLDETIPLSTGEYEEWGNPNEKIYHDYIHSYSPYDNVKKTKYPHILIQTGYHDPRVQYWEPAKWTAKLRDYKQDNNWLLLMTNMDSGHFGATGRLELLKRYSLYYAFLIGIEQGLI